MRRALLARAIELAEWAHERKHYVARNDMYRIVVMFDPEHVDAHKALGYRRRDGKWVPGNERSVRDQCETSVVEDCWSLRREALADFTARIDGIFATGEKTPIRRRAHLEELRQLLPLDPHSLELRTRFGEARDGDGGPWVLAETLAARAARLADAEALERLRRDAPSLTAADPDPATVGMTLVFPFHRRLGDATVACMRDQATADEVLLLAHLARASVFARFPNLAIPLGPARIFVLQNFDNVKVFLAEHPDIDAATRSALSEFGSAGFSATKQWYVSSESRQTRLEDTTLAWCDDALREIGAYNPRVGWMQHGSILHADLRLNGRRSATWEIANDANYAKRKLGKSSWISELPATSREWMHLAVELVGTTEPLENFERALTRDGSAFSWEDVVVSAVFAEYLIDGRRDDYVAIVDRTRIGETSTAAIEGQLGLPLEAVRERFLRWIAEAELSAETEDR